VYVAHEAKLSAEPTPGVGVETDLAMVRQKYVRVFADDEVTKLRRKQIALRRRATDAAARALEELGGLLSPGGEEDADNRS
jgi:hypothetical protein